jgi:hypothetical protein
MIVAFLLIAAGAALMAFAIFWAAVIVCTAGFVVAGGDGIACWASAIDGASETATAR